MRKKTIEEIGIKREHLRHHHLRYGYLRGTIIDDGRFFVNGRKLKLDDQDILFVEKISKN